MGPTKAIRRKRRKNLTQSPGKGKSQKPKNRLPKNSTFKIPTLKGKVLPNPWEILQRRFEMAGLSMGEIVTCDLSCIEIKTRNGKKIFSCDETSFVLCRTLQKPIEKKPLPKGVRFSKTLFLPAKDGKYNLRNCKVVPGQHIVITAIKKTCWEPCM